MEVEALLGRYFDAGTVARGRDYARRGKVESVERKGGSRPTGDVLLAEVRGSGGRTYGCLVTLGRGRDGSVTSITGSCTCPMKVDCKHVVATLVVDWERRSTPLEEPWERVLRGLAPEGPTRGFAPLGILLQFAAVPTVLRARPMTVGLRGTWVKQGMTWREATYRAAYDMAGHDPGQLGLLADLHTLARGSAAHRYYGESDTWLDLDAVTNPRAWELLADASAAGVALLRDDKDRSELTFGEVPARLTVQVGREGGLVLDPVLVVDDDVVPTSRFRLVGSPPHAVVHWDDPARWRLARLDRGVPTAIAEHLARGAGALRVPATDEARFVRDYLPTLRRQVAVVAVRGLELPEEVEPAAVLTVTHRPDHEAELRWRWEGTDPRPDERPASPFERAVLADLVVEAQGVVEVGRYGLRLAEARVVRGLELVRVLEEVLPAVAKVAHVRVEVEGEPADYRELVEPPVVTVSSAPTDDRDWYDLAVSVTVGGEPVLFHDLFVALARGDEMLMLPSGVYFSLHQEAFQRLRDLIEEARSLEDRPGRGLRINRYQGSLWEELAALGVVEDQAAAWQSAVRAAVAAPEPREVPASVQATLRPYQREGFAWLGALHDQGLGGVLADDMGLGKTLQTLTLIAAARESGTTHPYLVVAPASVVGNWVAESARFTPHLRAVAVQETAGRRGRDLAALVEGADVVVTSYTLFRLEFAAYEDLPWAGLILDEAQFVKNRSSKTYGCARLLPAPFKLAITGTPLENNLMELWSLLSITAPGLFPSPERFAERYQRPIERGHHQDRLALLRRRIGPFLLRRTKELVAADLPAKQEQVVELELHPRHRTVYDQHLQRERQKVLGMIDDLDANRFLIFRSLTLLRRLSLSPSLVDDAYARVPSTKLDELVPQLEEIVASGHKVLVFSQFTSFLGQVRERLDAVGVEHAYLDGRTRRRAEVIERFTGGEAPVFLISLKAGGFGLNLTAADYVFLLDPWWNPATEAQAVDRAHRIGQDKPVTVYRLVAKDTIEEKVMALKAAKAKLFDAVMSDEAATGRSLTAEDIRALLA